LVFYLSHKKLKKRSKATAKAWISAKESCLPAESASISYALPKKYTKRFGQKCRITNTDFSAKTATKTTTTLSTVNSASRSTPTATKTRMTISGSAAITAKDG